MKDSAQGLPAPVPRLLLLDLDSGSSLAESFRRTLDDGAGMRFDWSVARPANCSTLVQELPSVVSSAGAPDAVFALCPSRCSEPTCRLPGLIGTQAHRPPVIVVLPACEPDEANELLDQGVNDVWVNPIAPASVLPRLLRLLTHNGLPRASLHALKERLGLGSFVGESAALLTEIAKIPAIAGCDASVLVLGATGTGKELCARAVHYLSPRSDKPFTALNCGAIPPDLVENELFGHESGAFTGATTSSGGLLQEAEGGTLFLDEVDGLPLLAQVKLLRLLQEKEYRRLGSRKLLKADIRVLAATNSNIQQALDAGTFRRDLYYRLSTVVLTMPPLSARLGDIPLLASHFLKKFAREFKKPAFEFSRAAIQRLISYEWPGNVRELENVVARAVVLAETSAIQRSEIELPNSSATVHGSFRELKRLAVAEFERRYINEMLLACDGNISHAARAAHKNRRAFWQLMRKHGIHGRPTVQPDLRAHGLPA